MRSIVGGNVHELSLRSLQIVSFNLNHAKITGDFARHVFLARRNGVLQVNTRNIIPNDTKLFAQAHSENAVEFYLSSDTESKKIYSLLNQHTSTNFQFIDLNKNYTETFSLLNF